MQFSHHFGLIKKVFEKKEKKQENKTRCVGINSDPITSGGGYGTDNDNCDYQLFNMNRNNGTK